MSFLTKDAREDLTRRIALLAKGADDAAKSEQEARAHKYHITVKDGGNVAKPGEWSSVPDSAWGDPVNYRYPMPDKEHADNAASRWGDESNRSQYSADEQKIIGDRIKARQRHFGESMDEEEKKSADETDAQATVDAPELETKSVETPAEPVVTEPVVVEPEVELETKAAKAAKPAKPAKDDDEDAADEPDDDEDDEEGEDDGDGDEDKPAKKPAKKKPAKAPAEGEGDDGDKPSPRDDRFTGPLMEVEDEGKGEKKPAKGKKDGESAVVTPQAEALLASYNQLGAALGFAPANLSAKSLGDSEVVQLRSLAVVVDTAIDEALRLLNVPDNDAEIEGKSADGEIVTKSGASLSAATRERLRAVHDVLANMAGGVHCAAAVPQQNSAEEDELLQKRGASISRGNMGMIKKGHDVLATMCAGMHCADFIAQHSDAPAQMQAEEAAEKAAGEAIDVVKRFDTLATSFDAMAKAFGDLKALRDEAETVRNEIALARKSLGDLKTEAAEIEDNMRFYGNQPTVRPTHITTRQAPDGTVVDFAGNKTEAGVLAKGAATHAEPTTAEEARAATNVEYLAGVGRVRVWPKGYASGLRPSLDTDEMALMSATDILSYYNGGEVRVPVIG